MKHSLVGFLLAAASSQAVVHAAIKWHPGHCVYVCATEISK